jgi:hypothetical protein
LKKVCISPLSTSSKRQRRYILVFCGFNSPPG